MIINSFYVTGKQREKRVMIDLTENENNASSSKNKRKEVPSDLNNQKHTKRNHGEQENDPMEFENDSKPQLILIEIEERKMVLQERATADRKARAEIEKMELKNMIMKKQLKS